MAHQALSPVCRFCGEPLIHTFCNLGMSPPSNAYLSEENLRHAETFFPLHALVCDKCKLVQLEQFQAPNEIFSDYAYFSSYSQSWLQHAKEYAESMTSRLSLSGRKQVVEIASNDGYLLQYFHQKGISVLGIEPAENVAEVAISKGINTLVSFFGVETAEKLVAAGTKADLLLGNNVLAHVPDINDFVKGMAVLLAEDGTLTMEFPHLLQLIRFNQFDTIYHEHFSYLSLHTVKEIFSSHGLTIFDIDEIPTHGGSLRIYAQHNKSSPQPTESFDKVLADEDTAGINEIRTYTNFQLKVQETKRKLLSFLIDAKEKGSSVVCYGAAAKGNTLLNYCGIREDFVDYVVDKNPHKQGRFLPGTHIPIYSPERIMGTKPDYVLILPWNIQDEVIEQMGGVREWGGKFVVPIPEVKVLA
ncbi:MAG: class I SAM-dependent methyltransferase [Opitutae bacterium]|jgi:SAM-dependent methyltransferase|nr:class I SAM-dependent methyltransferase [Opitutae bacterium]MBT7727351.1 class I SAM-dependent methyltransferase [Planctomycetaceae bacterium]